MHGDARLPRNAKEGLLFLLIISMISANTIAPVIVGLERGFSKEVYLDTLKIIPVMWVIVVLLVKLVAGPLAGMLMPKFAGQTDGFNARILLNTLLNVTVISMLMSIIGTWVGTREVSLAPLRNYLHIWPRNFGIAFWIELLVAQPVARFVMRTLHARQARATDNISA
ncbi:hypothetical protein C2I18_05940 [Paenibacillus sp. PK3_47]|uniref:hypothetical protein n=1 Tax=Paenibacillus sp. PK3_47 TaxID=2072642 RepID=UPI00201DD13D|nr:hypothetical protein [Paenibacillus sp. PK3_47]UQZ33139.1 hypothetical protein C2I18_05940 [Paenibacillus sp. PK3_47]